MCEGDLIKCWGAHTCRACCYGSHWDGISRVIWALRCCIKAACWDRSPCSGSSWSLGDGCLMYIFQHSSNIMFTCLRCTATDVGCLVPTLQLSTGQCFCSAWCMFNYGITTCAINCNSLINEFNLKRFIIYQCISLHCVYLYAGVCVCVYDCVSMILHFWTHKWHQRSWWGHNGVETAVPFVLVKGIYWSNRRHNIHTLMQQSMPSAWFH